MVNVAILGFGTVGSGVAEVIHKNGNHISEKVANQVNLKYILDIRDFPDSIFADKVIHDFNIIEQDPEVDVVVETKRGHKLGRIIREGSAAPNSGVPGIIGGYGAERVLHAQAAGIFRNLHSIADFVEADEAVAEIETPDGQRLPVVTQISGILRGLLRDGYPVTKGFKVADVDPRRAELENCFLISDKARCIAGSVLELIAAACWN